MIYRMLFSAFLFAALSPSVFADGLATQSFNKEAQKFQGPSVVVTKIFDQVLRYTLPRGFIPAYSNTNGNQYIQEAVPVGESVNKWTQMVTATGAKGLVANFNLTPDIFADKLANGYYKICPSSFSANGLGSTKIDGYDSNAAVISCGLVNANGEQYSESMLLIVIKGKSDYYTIQWAERGLTSNTPIALDKNKWIVRLRALMPLGVCTVLPEESAPYQSCINKK